MVGVRAYIFTPLIIAAIAALGAYAFDRKDPIAAKRADDGVIVLAQRAVSEGKADQLPTPAKREAAAVATIKALPQPPPAPELPAVLVAKPQAASNAVEIVGSLGAKPAVTPSQQIPAQMPQGLPSLPIISASPLPLERPLISTPLLPMAPLPLPRPTEIASLAPATLAAPQGKAAESPVPSPLAPTVTAPAPATQTPATLSTRLAAKGFALGDATFIRIFKEEAKLEVWMSKGGSYSLFESFPICKYSGGFGPKQMQGDYQSPEGFYMVGRRQLNPNSAYHLAFNLGYPNAYDKAHGRSGSALMVHGECKSVGCYAMTNKGIEQIYAIVEAALNKQAEVPVHIFPFRPTKGALFRHMFHPWRGFWTNLAEGYEAFEQTKQPPAVGVCNRTYVFGDQAAGCQRIAAW